MRSSVKQQQQQQSAVVNVVVPKTPTMRFCGPSPSTQQASGKPQTQRTCQRVAAGPHQRGPEGSAACARARVGESSVQPGRVGGAWRRPHQAEPRQHPSCQPSCCARQAHPQSSEPQQLHTISMCTGGQMQQSSTAACVAMAEQSANAISNGHCNSVHKPF